MEVARLMSSEIGIIQEFDKEKDKYLIQVLTSLFDDYKFITLSSKEFELILKINTKSDIHNYGLSTLKSIRKFNLIFHEPLLIPFAPRIENNDNDNDDKIVNEITKWFNDINQNMNKNKLIEFMKLSYHNKGPIVENVDKFLSKYKDKLMNDSVKLNDLRKALLIDGANTFNQGTYQLICRINHCCDPNCMIFNDGSVKSLRFIKKNEELLWNFLDDKYLYYSTEIRITALYNVWGFKCNCYRCNAHFDDIRVFLCIKCGKPSIYVSYQYQNDKDDLNILTKFHDCFQCHYKLKSHEIEYYLLIESKIDDIIKSKDYDYAQFKQCLNHIKNYLSKEHFKWFDLYYSIIINKKYLLFNKSIKYFLKKCYKSLQSYNNCMNYCRFNIEWKLFNCLIDERNERNERKSCDIDKKDRNLINKLFNSIKESKDLFINIEEKKWIEICEFVKNFT